MRALPGRVLLGFAVLAAALAAAGPARAHGVEGELYGLHADYFDDGMSTTRWQLETAHGTVGVLPTTLPALTADDNEVTVHDEDPGSGVAGPVTAAAPPASPTLGAHKLAVIAFNFLSNPVQPWTKAQIRSAIFTSPSSTNAFYREESHDQLRFTGRTGNLDGDVYGWYSLPPPVQCRDDGTDAKQWRDQAVTQATALDGFNPDDYDQVMLVFPAYSGCRWAGLGEIGGKYSWINGGDNGVLTVRVTGHELGHNLGVHHANSWDCVGTSNQPVPISAKCTSTEYNDPYDVMGSFASRHHNGWHLEQLGILPPSNIQTVTAQGTYSLTAADSSGLPTALRIPSRYGDGDGKKQWYYLEVRKAGGVFENFLASDPVATGVTVRLNDDPSKLTQSRLIDTDIRDGITDSAAQPGETFSDGQISVTTLSAGNGTATVFVNMAAPPLDEQIPSRPTALSHVLLGTGLRLLWRPSADNIGVHSYAIDRDGMEIGSTAGLSFDDTSVMPGRHAYTVYALDAAGNRSAASAPYVVDVPAQNVVQRKKKTATDRKAPRLRLYRKRLRGHVLLLTARANDGSGIARVELRIDGRKVRSKRAGKLSYRWHLRKGRHRIVVIAYDKRGNRATYRLSLRVPA